MRFFFTLLGITKAHAQQGIDSLGNDSPGIADMWAAIRATFPHTQYGAGGLSFILLRITDVILKSIGALAIVFIMYAGIKMVTGGEEGLGEAKKIVMYAVIGLIGAIMADAIVLYIAMLVSQVAS